MNRTDLDSRSVLRNVVKKHVSRIKRSFRTKKNFEEYLYDEERQIVEEYLGTGNIQLGNSSYSK